MKVAIIGAGNMGSAIARGLAQGYLVQGHEIVVFKDMKLLCPTQRMGNWRN